MPGDAGQRQQLRRSLLSVLLEKLSRTFLGQAGSQHPMLWLRVTAAEMNIHGLASPGPAPEQGELQHGLQGCGKGPRSLYLAWLSREPRLSFGPSWP